MGGWAAPLLLLLPLVLLLLRSPERLLLLLLLVLLLPLVLLVATAAAVRFSGARWQAAEAGTSAVAYFLVSGEGLRGGASALKQARSCSDQVADGTIPLILPHCFALAPPPRWTRPSAALLLRWRTTRGTWRCAAALHAALCCAMLCRAVLCCVDSTMASARLWVGTRQVAGCPQSGTSNSRHSRCCRALCWRPTRHEPQYVTAPQPQAHFNMGNLYRQLAEFRRAIQWCARRKGQGQKAGCGAVRCVRAAPRFKTAGRARLVAPSTTRLVR